MTEYEDDDPWGSRPAAPVGGERVAPHEPVAEQSVLGAAMLSKRALAEVTGVLNGVDFYEPKHETIFDAILELAGAGRAVDAITVGDQLTSTGRISEVPDGAVYLHTLTSIVPSAANALYYAEIVRDRAAQRRMIEFGEKVATAGYKAEGDPAEQIEILRTEMEGLLGEQGTSIAPISHRWEAFTAALDEAPEYVPTPWTEINDMIGGFSPGGLYIVGARPGGGKSNAGLQIAAALAASGPVAYSALEMSTDQMLERLVAQVGQIPLSSLKRHDLSAGEAAQLGLAHRRIDGLPLFIDERSGVTVQQVKAYARSVARKGPIAGVVVDYLQLISSHDSRMKVHEMVGEIARQLKVLAGELRCPVIALAQLNRDSVQVKGPKAQQTQRPPTLADLAKSDDIGMHADVVLMLQRKLESDGEPGDVLEMYVVKNRHGRSGRRSLRWEGKFARITSQPIGMF
ncbi:MULTISPECIES: replicative DNA helicase [unclassified Leucobacter]|uniref:replicative DNA helicase n=1 Tax=unclassified Leucobacter TaxID=2621730 RepID=UPI000622A68C|nr:DnaB-like helicase C-terminal domain-containing protein [Leucobacter sp. Ag1]KKI16393.1 hypothetical protein XM48_16510 [Leucobacter sp. Ag1]